MPSVCSVQRMANLTHLIHKVGEMTMMFGTSHANRLSVIMNGTAQHLLPLRYPRTMLLSLLSSNILLIDLVLNGVLLVSLIGMPGLAVGFGEWHSSD